MNDARHGLPGLHDTAGHEERDSWPAMFLAWTPALAGMTNGAKDTLVIPAKAGILAQPKRSTTAQASSGTMIS